MAKVLNFKNRNTETDFDKIINVVTNGGYTPTVERKNGLILLKYSDAFVQKCDMFTSDGKYIASITKEITISERVHMATEKLFDRFKRYCRNFYLRVRYSKSEYQCIV